MEFALALRLIGALAVIALVLLGLQTVGRSQFRKRLRFPGGNRLVTVVETTHLPNAASLHVVKIGEAYTVVGRSGAYVGKVADIPDATISGWLDAKRRHPLSGRD